MSSILRPSNHRRRSQSASTSSSSNRRGSESSRLAATKRARPHSCFFGDYSYHSQRVAQGKWTTKRRRRDLFSVNSSDDDEIHENEDRMDLSSDDYADPHISTPAFAATSAEFHLFNRPSARYGSRHGIAHIAPHNSHADSISPDELNSLRSSALWELQRSILENGEGLVRRMRDYERTRSRMDTFTKVKDAQKRGKKRSSLLNFGRRDVSPQAESEEEDDDIQIFSGDFPQPFLGREIRHKGSSGSETNLGSWSVPSSDRCSSPCSSLYMTDDEQALVFETDQPQYLHQDHSTSRPQSIPLCTPHDNPSFTLSHRNEQATSPPSSRSEKAIAALTLALANGSAGINDYEALRNLQPALALDDSQVGEMW